MLKIRNQSFAGVLLLASLVPAVRAATISVVSPGQSILGNQLFVGIATTQITDLYAYQFDLAFNPSILQLVSIQEGTFLSSAGATVFIPGTIDNTLGLATFTIGSVIGFVPGASGNGTLADFLFTGISAGTSSLDLSNVELLDSNFDDLVANQVDGSVNVVTPEPDIPGWMIAAAGACGIFALRRRRNTLSRHI